MSTLRDVANRFPRLKAVAKAVLAPLRARPVSSHYVELSGAEAGEEAARLRGSWQDGAIPSRQRELVDRQLSAYRRGAAVDNFDVMRRALEDINLALGPVTLLEVGCSSGYYSEVITPVPPGFSYAGCDYSAAFVAMARRLYPELRFDIEDTTRLTYPTGSFDVVVSGCCLLHVPDYATGVKETARVARQAAIFHRTPVVIGQAEKVFRKLAFGVETVEIHVNEQDFLALLKANGLELVATHTLSEAVSNGVGRADRTYVCRKAAA